MKYLIFTMIFCWQIANADTVRLIADRDNTLYEIDNGSLSNGVGSYIFAGSTGANGVRRSLLHFDLSLIPTGSIINAVKLSLYMDKSRAGASNLSVHRVLTDWGEGESSASGGEGSGGLAAENDATWLHSFYADKLWNQPGGDYKVDSSSDMIVADEGFYTWSNTGLIEDVKYWLESPDLNFGWAIIGDESKTSTAKRFISRNFSDPELHPRLIIEYTPDRETVIEKKSWAELKSK